MNKNLLIPFAIIIIGAIIGTVLLLRDNATESTVGVPIAQANLRKVDLEIDNMFCLGCRSSVVNTVKSLPGVVEADADPGTDSGWVLYDPDLTSKEEIVAATIFQAYPARILGDQLYTKKTGQTESPSSVQGEIPPEIEQKVNKLAQVLQAKDITIEPFFQDELDDAISSGYWDKAHNLLDNFLQAYQ